MPGDIYEVVAQAARYWFLFLMALIAWRSYRWLARDRKQRRKRKRLLPDAGYVGEWVLQRGNADLPVGLALPVGREGVLGSVRGADVCLPARGVARRHLWYEFDEDEGLYVEPYGRQTAEADGMPLAGRRAHVWLAHGSRLTVGGVELRLRMFMGFESAGAMRPAALFGDAEPVAAQPAAMPAAATGYAPEQLAAYQAQQAAAQAAAAMGYGPEQLAAYQTQLAAAQAAAMGFAPEQLAAYQAQLAAAQAAAMGYTPEQLAAYQAQAARKPAAAATEAPAVLSTAQGEFLAPPKLTLRKAILPAEADGLDGSAPPEPAEARRGAPPPPEDAHPAPEGYEAAAQRGSDSRAPDARFAPSLAHTAENPTFAPRVTFYPPVMDDAPEGDPEGALGAAGTADDAWPMAAFPQSDARFVDAGYTYPEYVEPDMPYEYADEDEAPRSLYVEPDEAERAKRLLWDKYLKGGKRS